MTNFLRTCAEHQHTLRSNVRPHHAAPNTAHPTPSPLLLQIPEDSEWAYVSASDDDKADGDDEEDDDEDEEGSKEGRLLSLMQRH